MCRGKEARKNSMQTTDMLLLGGAVALYLFFSGALEGLFGGVTGALGGVVDAASGAASTVIGTAEDGLNKAGSLGGKAVDAMREGAENLPNPSHFMDTSSSGFVATGGVPGAAARVVTNLAGAAGLPSFPDMNVALPKFDFGFDFDLGDLSSTLRNILPF